MKKEPSDTPLFIIGSILAALLVIFGTRTFLEIWESGHDEEQAGYTLPEPPADGEKQAAGDATGTPAGGFDAAKVAGMIASADADKGSKLFRQCAACHSFKKGDAPLIGPNLWNVVGRDVASSPDFGGYSEAMKSREGSWSFSELATFVHSPKGTVPGTKMIFAGISDEGKLADVLAYLRTLSDSPAPVPEPVATEEKQAATPTEEKQAAKATKEEQAAGDTTEAASPAPAGSFDAAKVAGMVTAADADKGSKLFRRCAACHSVKKGTAPLIGPNLWNVVGRDVASSPEFDGYSEAMKNKEGSWTLPELATFVHDPKGTVPGTKMIFAGISNEGQLADVLAYLRTLSDSPAPVQ